MKRWKKEGVVSVGVAVVLEFGETVPVVRPVAGCGDSILEGTNLACEAMR